MSKRVYLEKAGCNRRQLDLEKIRSYLEANGYTFAHSPKTADLILLGTCAFKEKEEDESVARLRALRKYNKQILVYGCLPDIARDRYREFQDIPKIAPKEIEKISAHLAPSGKSFEEVSEPHVLKVPPADLLRSAAKKVTSGEVFSNQFVQQAAFYGVRYLKNYLQHKEGAYYLFLCRGCVGKCSYCAIKFSVGTVKSKPSATVLEELREGWEQGHRFYSLLGDDPGCYGLDIDSSFPELLEALVAESAKLDSRQQGRPIGFEIKEMHPKFLIRYIDRLRQLPLERVDNLLCPIQSGSDRVLEAMQREHSGAEIRDALLSLRQRFPGMTLDTQIIAGFPSETEEEFRQTLELVRDVAFDSVVVFPYHNKRHTAASGAGGHLGEADIERRMREAFAFFKKSGVRAFYSCPS